MCRLACLVITRVLASSFAWIIWLALDRLLCLRLAAGFSEVALLSSQRAQRRWGI